MRASLAVLALALTLPTSAQPATDPLPAAQRAAVATWQADWQTAADLAPADDFAFIDSYRQDADASFTPYYTTGDFDRDGYGDFAVLVVGPPIDEPGTFRESYVLVFNGEGGGAYSLRHIGLADPEGGDAHVGLLLTMDDEGYLMLVQAETDVGEQVFVPFRGGYAIYQAEGG